VLKDLGLVHGERRGYRVHYFLDQERLAEYQELARELLGETFVVVVGDSSASTGAEGGKAWTSEQANVRPVHGGTG
jgi:hypothetical protein